MGLCMKGVGQTIPVPYVGGHIRGTATGGSGPGSQKSVQRDPRAHTFVEEPHRLAMRGIGSPPRRTNDA